MIIATVREFLRAKLSPGTYHQVRYAWWLGDSYLPRSIASFVYASCPHVRVYPVDKEYLWADQLRHLNTLRPTAMCRAMTRYGSDKGQGWHNYTVVYSSLFRSLRDRPLRLFELGVGTDNPELVSTMRANGSPGASLRGWRTIFPKARIYGADIDRNILFQEERIKTFYCDQLDQAAIRAVWSQPELQGGVDVIIDDGLHTFAGNTSFLEGSLNQLLPGGFHIVEDILQSTVPKWQLQLEIYAKRFPKHEFALVELPNRSNNYDNNLVIVRRAA